MGAVIIVEYPLYAKYMIIINDKIKPNMLNIAVPFFIYKIIFIIYSPNVIIINNLILYRYKVIF